MFIAQNAHQKISCSQRDRRTWDCLNHTGKKAEREARRNTSIEAAHAAAEDKRKAHVQRLKDSKTYVYGFWNLVLAADVFMEWKREWFAEQPRTGK